jgi:hypothetical protein
MVGRRPTTEAVRPTTGHFVKIEFFTAIDAIKHETFTFAPVFFSADTKLASHSASFSSFLLKFLFLASFFSFFHEKLGCWRKHP